MDAVDSRHLDIRGGRRTGDRRDQRRLAARRAGGRPSGTVSTTWSAPMTHEVVVGNQCRAPAALRPRRGIRTIVPVCAMAQARARGQHSFAAVQRRRSDKPSSRTNSGPSPAADPREARQERPGVCFPRAAHHLRRSLPATCAASVDRTRDVVVLDSLERTARGAPRGRARPAWR